MVVLFVLGNVEKSQLFIAAGRLYK